MTAELTTMTAKFSTMRNFHRFWYARFVDDDIEVHDDVKILTTT